MGVKSRKNSVKTQKKKKVITENELCVLCGKLTEDPYMGKLLTVPTMVAHENCLLFSPILKQVDDPDVDQEGYILGFKISDVKQEVKRITRLKCRVCKSIRAGIGCCNASCKKSFHLSCGLNKNAVGIFKDCFQFFCSDHAEIQELNKHFASCDETVPECTICLDSLIEDDVDESSKKITKAIQWEKFQSNVSDRTVIHGQCCSRCWMHRACMRQYGLSAGLHHAKCPNCGDKTIFIEAVIQCGIWLPDRDASWELEPGAYQELYNNTDDDPDASMDVPASATHNTTQDTSIEDIENKCIKDEVVRLSEIPVSGSHEVVMSPVRTESNSCLVTSTTACLSPPRLRKRKRQSDVSNKSTPTNTAKRRRTSKNSSMGVIVQRKCARCTKSIVSIGCNQGSVLNEANRKNQVNNLDATEEHGNVQIEYVCVSCHK